jgi:hypothetical protein
MIDLEDTKVKAAVCLMALIGTRFVLNSFVWQYKHYQLNKKAAYERQPLPVAVVEVQVNDSQIILILGSDATKLRRAIIDGHVSCKQVVSVYANRCFKHGRQLKVLAQEYYKQAMEIAE